MKMVNPVLLQGYDSKCAWGTLQKTVAKYIIDAYMCISNPNLSPAAAQVLLANSMTYLIPPLLMLAHKMSHFTRIQLQTFH